MVIVAVVFQIPAVQTRMAAKATQYLNEEFGTDIRINRIRITVDGKVKAKQVYLGDHHGDTLIASESLKTSLLNIPGILKGTNIDFGDVTAEQLTFRLRRYLGDDKDSFGIFLDKLESENPEEKGAIINFKHLTVIDSKFSFYDEQSRYPDIISLTHLDIDASRFIIDGSDISVKINALNGKEKRGVEVEDLSTRFELNEGQMNFHDFHLLTAHSDISAQVFFTYEETMADFENSVQVAADFEKAKVSTTDLMRYYDQFSPGHTFNFMGEMKGVLNRFSLENMNLYGVNRTFLDGNIQIVNMLSDDPFVISGDFKNLETNYNDVTNLLPRLLKNKIPKDLKNLGQVRLTGSLSATGQKVTTQSFVRSDLGRANLDITLDNLQATGKETYLGKVDFENFDLGDLLNNPKLGEADFDVHIEGKGLNGKTINSQLDGNFSALEFNGYIYHDIDVNGILKSPVFTGEVISRDPNLQMTFNGSADISAKDNDYDFKADVAYADFHALNFNKSDSISQFKGAVALKMKGKNVDNIVGEIQFSQAIYLNRKGTHHFEEFGLTASLEDSIRKIDFNSPDIVEGYVKGKFKISEIGSLLRNSIGNLYANYKPEHIGENQNMQFDIAIHSKIVEALFPDISLAAGTSIRGEVRSDDSNIKLAFKSPEIDLYQNKLMGVNLQLDTTNPLFATHFVIDSASTNFYRFSKVNLTSNRKNDTLFVNSYFTGGEDDIDSYNLKLYHTINKDNKSVVGILPSELNFRNAGWTINEHNEDQKIIFDTKFENLQTDTIFMTYKDQKIAFSGYKKGSNEMQFNLNFSQVNLENITPALDDFAFKGIMNGSFELNKKDGNYYPGSNLRIENLAVNDIPYGDLELGIEGNRSLTSYAVSAQLQEKGIHHLDANGIINVDKNNPSIAIDVSLNDFDIGILNAFGKEVISDIRGGANGYAKVSGNYKRPNIDGELRLEKGGIKIPYLNVDLKLESNALVQLKQQQFYFNHIKFEDAKYETQGEVDGTISHRNFRDWAMDLSLNAPERLLVLDTQYTEEALYYGTAFISGNARLHGPFDELVIDADATSRKGTVFKIPLKSAESVASSNFIYFLTSEDKEAREKGEDIIVRALKGMQLNFDLDVTDDADIEIVVDEQSGSTLRGKGAGTLLMEINTNGKFNMWGDFVVYKGVYNFQYAGLIEKDFEVVSGGSVTWDGNPLQANLNVRALYQTEANPASILENPTVNRPIPVNVYVELTGPLNNVDIDFSLEYPNLSSVVKSELEYRINDRESIELQAMSLIAQRSFYSDLGTGRNTHPENLLYERAAGIFNDIFSGEEDIFKVGVNYTKGNRTPDQEYSDRVGVTLSTNVSDRVLINGRVGVPIGGLTRSVVVGNLEMEILLNEEGTLRAKLFNRESDIQYIGEELGYTQGVGLTYSVDFDTFKELINKVLNKKMEIEDIPNKMEAETEEKESLVPDYIKFPGS